jgi:carbamoyl-phosphate synthase large subunit
VPPHIAVKESVFPFAKFPGVDTILGPEMRSTGEVMGLAENFPLAFLKAQLSASGNLPERGRVFVSVRDEDKPAACEIAQRLVDLGFQVLATSGTKSTLDRAGVPSELVNKVREGRPHIVDRLRNGDVAMVVNTTEGAHAIRDSYTLRRQTLISGMPYFTTIAAATAAVGAIEARREAPLSVRSVQEYHEGIAAILARRPSIRPGG